jgi:hypothetical protein
MKQFSSDYSFYTSLVDQMLICTPPGRNVDEVVRASILNQLRSYHKGDAKKI